MKKTIYTFIAFAALFLSFSNQTRAQVTNNFEDGNWLYYKNLCWGIGPNNSDYGTDVTGNGFNNTDICQTENLGQKSPCVLTSPWVRMEGAGTISFNHAIPSYNGTRSLTVSLISYPSLAEEVIFTHTYTNGTALLNSIPVNKTGNYKVKWLWTGSDGNSRGQLDNISMTGIYNSDPSNGCNPLPDPIVDTDSDGVPDSQDIFPTDQYRAYVNYYPAADTSTLVFEDLWPSYGDYDLNDMVVGYKFRIISNAQHNVVDIYSTFVLRAAGASLANGFGFQFPNVDPDAVISTTGYDLGTSTTFSLSSNGTESGHNSATFIVFDKARRFLPHGNTTVGNVFDNYKYFPVYIKFMDNGVPGPGGAVSINDLSIQDFNPFLASNDDRGKEVHLPGYAPTVKANSAYFGTGDDDTNPGIGKYYQSKTNLTWAMDISATFEYPQEKIPVTECYNHFNTWVQSSGSQYPDWFMDKPGYRNNNKIY